MRKPAAFAADSTSRPRGVLRPCRAFTLLEVLLALALFALSVVVLTSAYLNILEGLESVKANRDFEQEVRWVREQVLLKADLEETLKGGEAQSPAATGLRWTVNVQPTAVADLFTLDLHVEMVAGDKPALEYNERLSVLRPSWSEPVERGNLVEEAKQRIEEDRRRRGLVATKRS